jgi:hypothetical protein
MLLAYVFDAKVVHDECELDGASCVFPQSWCVPALVVSVNGESLRQEFIGEDACLR